MGLTKTLKFDDDVLDVFRAMEWTDDGTLGLIIGGQLERNLYQRCNKAYDALGGKWDRNAGGIVFKTDPRPQIEGLITDGQLQVERDGFFETPRAVVERMLERVPPDTSNDALTLEPSAGLGAIVRILKQNGVQWMSIVEKNMERAKILSKEFESQDTFVQCNDFLDYQRDGYLFDRIYMNPPFEELQDIDHVKHAYDLLADGGKMVSVMSESAFFRSDKKSAAFREWLDEVNAQVEKLPNGSFKESGTGVNTQLVVIAKASQ
jgi:16S rRNA G966 N2-methylase RsmD